MTLLGNFLFSPSLTRSVYEVLGWNFKIKKQNAENEVKNNFNLTLLTPPRKIVNYATALNATSLLMFQTRKNYRLQNVMRCLLRRNWRRITTRNDFGGDIE